MNSIMLHINTTILKIVSDWVNENRTNKPESVIKPDLYHLFFKMGRQTYPKSLHLCKQKRKHMQCMGWKWAA